MTVLFGIILCISNFVTLSVFSGCLLFFYHRKQRVFNETISVRVRHEEEKLESLANDLLKASEILMERLADKEKDVAVLIDEIKIHKSMFQNMAEADEKRFETLLKKYFETGEIVEKAESKLHQTQRRRRR